MYIKYKRYFNILNFLTVSIIYCVLQYLTANPVVVYILHTFKNIKSADITTPMNSNIHLTKGNYLKHISFTYYGLLRARLQTCKLSF